jgi:hypothetical protein
MSGAGVSKGNATSMVGILNNIYDLLGKGILVYPRRLQGNKLPRHLRKIAKLNEERATSRREIEESERRENESLNEEIYEAERERSEYGLRQRYRQFAPLRDIIGTATGLSDINEKSPLNALATTIADSGIKLMSGLFNSGSTSFDSPGIFEESQYERSLTDNSYESMLNTLSQYKDGQGIAASASRWLYKVIERKKKKQEDAASKIDPDKSVKEKSKPTKEDRARRIIAAIQRAYEKFYENNILRRNAVTPETSEERNECIIIMAQELKNEGFTEVEAINTISQIIEEPIGDDAYEPLSEKTISSIEKIEKVSLFDRMSYSASSGVNNIKGLGGSALSGIRNVFKRKEDSASSQANIARDIAEAKEIGTKIGNVTSIISEGNIPKAESITPDDIKAEGGVVIDKKGNILGTAKEYIDGQLPMISGLLLGFMDKIKTLFSRTGVAGKEKSSIEAGLDNAIGSMLPDVAGKFGGLKDSIKDRLDSVLKPEKNEKELSEDEEERGIALTSYNILEETLQELVSSLDNKEPTFSDIEKSVDAKVREGLIDRDIADSVLDKAFKIANDGDKKANPVNAYYSAIYTLKESYNTKYRKKHSLTSKIVKKILGGGVKTIAATSLLFSGHPIMAAMLAFGPKRTIKGAVGGAKALFKGSKLLAKLNLKVLGVAARMSPGFIKSGLGLVSKILSGDIFERKVKKSREELDKEKQIAAMTFTALENLHREIMEGNPDANISEIKRAINDKVKSGAIEGEIADAIIKVTEQNSSDKDADATPLGAFLQAILTLKKQYAKDYRKETSITRKIAMGILKGAGKGIGAAALLLSGHPIMAAALALSGGPTRLLRSLSSKFAKKGSAVPLDNPLVAQKKDILDESGAKVTDEAEKARSSILQKIPGIISDARKGTAEGLAKAKGAIGGVFGSFREKVGGFFQERREGSLLDAREDKKEAKRDEVQEKTLQILEEIRDNTEEDEDEGGEGKGKGKKNKKDKNEENKAPKQKGAAEAAIDIAIGTAINSVLSKAFGAMAGKSGAVGTIGKIGKFLVGGGKAGATAASAGSKVAGAASAASKGGGLTGRILSLFTKVSIIFCLDSASFFNSRSIISVI